MTRAMLGLDIGTTNIKALIVREDGAEIAFAKRASPFVEFEGHSVQMPEPLFDRVCDMIAEVVSAMERAGGRRQDIVGAAVASMGEMGVPMDERGAIYPAIAWHDPCTVPQADRLRARLGDERMLDIAGQRILHIFTVAKLMWLKDEKPDIYRRMRRFHCMADYVAGRLGGGDAMDHSIAARTGLLNCAARAWSPEIFEAAGLDPAKMPPLVPSGAQIGRIGADIARRTGLPEGIGIYAGGYDHVCGAFACGATREGVFLDSSGTSETIITAASDARVLRAAGAAGFNVGPHAKAGTNFVMAGMTASGLSVDWYRREFGDSDALQPNIGGLCYLPHLRGSSSPTRNALSRGAFLGIRDTHARADFLQAVYEGLAMELRGCAEQLARAVGEDIRDIMVIGGGTNNAAWLQTKANVLKRPLKILAVREATAMGAALLAGIGAGLFRDADDAVARTRRVAFTVEPEAAHAAYCDEKYEIYRTLYERLLPVNAELSAFAGGAAGRAGRG